MKIYQIVTPIAAIIIASCGGQDKKNNQLLKYPVANPEFKDTVYKTEYVADVHSLQNVEIRSRIKGYLERIYVDEGAKVRKGQLLFSLGNQIYKEELMKFRAQLKIAMAEAKKAEVEYQNVKILKEKNVVSLSELQKSEASLEALRAKVEEARSWESLALLHLSQTEIKAPFDGIISRIPFKAGSLINEGELLTTISNNQEVFAYFNVSEREYLHFVSKKDKPDAGKLTLILANNEMHKYPGKIETIDGEIDKNTGNIAFRARFPNPELILKHGSSGRILIENELNNALIIPQKATYEIQDKVYVFVLDADNRVKSRNISVSMRLPHLYVVGSGLSVKDLVVLEGIQNLKENDQIKPEITTIGKFIPKNN